MEGARRKWWKRKTQVVWCGLKIFKFYDHPEIRVQIEVMKDVPGSD
jgi:hypothetical protein